MKKVLLDSSSAILMEKTDLLDIFLKLYRVTLTQGVFDELTLNHYPSADLFSDRWKRNQFVVCEVASANSLISSEPLKSLNRGERETIEIFLKGSYDFIMLDDGKAAKFCLKKQLPFINALLLPRILHCVRLISKEQQGRFTSSILQEGRYSEQIIKMAAGFDCEQLTMFYP